VASVRAVSTNLSAYAFARGLRGGIFMASMPNRQYRRQSVTRMEEIRGEHRRGLRVQELPPCRVSAPSAL